MSSKDHGEIELVMKLLALAGPSGGEEPVANFITKRLTQAGLPKSAIHVDKPPDQSPVSGKQGNLVVHLPGTARGARRMLVAHMDTVPVCAGAEPVLKGSRIDSAGDATGLGADDRAGCAVLLSTLLHLLRHKPAHPPLTFLWTVQEEVGLHGARAARLGLIRRPKMAFNWDGRAANQLTIGATGGYRMRISVGGVASHAGGHPEQGVSAIAIASIAIASLVEYGWHGLVQKRRRVGTSNVGVIRGGAATNVVADRVDLWAEARSHDAKFRARIVREIEKAFHAAARKVKNVDGVRGRVELDGRTDYEAFRLERDSPCVQTAAAAVATEQLEVDYTVANGGLDANWLTARGIPTVSLGCGQNAIHTVNEWLDVDQYLLACRIALRIAAADH